MQEKREKIRYLDNVKYMFQNWAKWNAKSFMYLLVWVPALIVVPMLGAYVPKAMIDSIEAGVSIPQLVLKITLISGGIAAASWIGPFMQQKMQGAAEIIRMRYAVLAFNKLMTCDYVDVESLSGRERFARSRRFTGGDGMAYSSYFCTVVCQFAVAVFGLITSAALLVKLPVLMLVLILAASAAEFFVFLQEFRYDEKVRTKTSQFYVKLNYFYRASHDFFAGKDIRLYGLADWFARITAGVMKSLVKVQNKYLRVSFTVTTGRALISMLRDLAAYFFLIAAVLNESITVSDFIFYFGIVTGFSGYISVLLYQLRALKQCALECQKYREFVQRPQEGAADKPDLITRGACSIEFQNVGFRYPDAETQTIHNMSFSVRPGENVAIVGENGAGKTTAIKLLCGLYAPGSGKILVNGRDIKDYSQKSIFDLFSVVFQDYHFLPLSIEKNIALQAEEQIDHARVAQVLQKAGMKEKIDSLPQGAASHMDKTIYKDAVDFSGGEKQKLLLARALYKDAPILVLDEPTAALDPIAENELYLQYSALSKGKTSFFISHRLSSTRFCDRILFIADGTVDEAGTHEELMAKKGRYYRMYQLQSYYYKEAVV